ncbi:hypothetical protein V6N13_029863 [Hibiscus sabdariffa]
MRLRQKLKWLMRGLMNHIPTQGMQIKLEAELEVEVEVETDNDEIPYVDSGFFESDGDIFEDEVYQENVAKRVAQDLKGLNENVIDEVDETNSDSLHSAHGTDSNGHTCESSTQNVTWRTLNLRCV